MTQSFVPVPCAGWRGRMVLSTPGTWIRSCPGRPALHGAGPGRAGTGGWRREPSAGAGGATHAGGGLAARRSPAPRSLKAPFSRSAGSSPEEAEAT